MSLINILVTILAAVFVFLFAIQKFSNQVRLIGGDRIKDLITKTTATPFRGVVTGSIITAIVQSSTAVTVILVGLVNAGIVSFYNSLGVILGANIGTTLISQLIAFKIIYLAPYIVIAGFILDRVKNKYERFGKIVFYFGLILLSLLFITVLTEPLQSNPHTIGLLSKVSNIFVAILVGIVASTLLQSSAVVSSIVIILVAQGLFEFKEAFGIILGSNIGTTSTALIAASVMDASARKTAIAHFLFNVIGVILFLPFIGYLSDVISRLGLSSESEVAISNFIFNVITAIIFLVGIRLFHKIVTEIYHYFWK